MSHDHLFISGNKSTQVSLSVENKLFWPFNQRLIYTTFWLKIPYLLSWSLSNLWRRLSKFHTFDYIGYMTMYFLSLLILVVIFKLLSMFQTSLRFNINLSSKPSSCIGGIIHTLFFVVFFLNIKQSYNSQNKHLVNLDQHTKTL